MARIADTLTESGHNVTFFVPIFDDNRSNQLGVKLTKNVIKMERSEEMKLDPVTMDNVTSSFWNINVNSKEGHSLFDPVHKLTVQSCRSLFSNAELLATLRSHEYDVGISEPMMTCSLALFRHLGIQKTILASSCPNFDVVMAAMGEPAETSYVPAIYSSVSGDRMDFADRLENYDMYHFMVKRYGQVFDDEAKVYRSFLGQDFPDWRELIPDASVHFTNSISYLDFPRPSIQKTIDIGGITVDVEQIESQKLSNEFNAILDKQEKTMFISFGSMAKSFEMPQNYKENLLEVFKSEPNVTFIWKYESNVSFAEGLDNLELVKWAPQTTLLNDKRMSAFLSHGGLGSTIETVFFGKPTIMIPIFFDQFRNSHMLSRLGTSVTLLKTDLGNLDKLKSAFHKILHNDSFRKNAGHVADVVRNQPIKPKELVVKYTEFVGNHGPFHHMTPYSLKMPWFQRHGYDVLLYKSTFYLLPSFLFLASFRKFVFSRNEIPASR
ncbi:hypothetical protein L3Y34_007339 [Caenorhabditis briggsae]|uniref:UDP-glucuronosyltransferase n=1 Tax=Caenorhabditis briggsae TaxID=6238 RepID=A0AAE8ZYJ9_CAEBR|nr:hypothetical protein L3Y34_007339 [Caenorhabditis briggsae]